MPDYRLPDDAAETAAGNGATASTKTPSRGSSSGP
jgi:hypothetical protein